MGQSGGFATAKASLLPVFKNSMCLKYDADTQNDGNRYSKVKESPLVWIPVNDREHLSTLSPFMVRLKCLMPPLTKLTLTEIEQVDGGLEYLMARFGLIGSGRQPIAPPLKLTKTLVETRWTRQKETPQISATKRKTNCERTYGQVVPALVHFLEWKVMLLPMNMAFVLKPNTLIIKSYSVTRRVIERYGEALASSNNWLLQVDINGGGLQGVLQSWLPRFGDKWWRHAMIDKLRQLTPQEVSQI